MKQEEKVKDAEVVESETEAVVEKKSKRKKNAEKMQNLTAAVILLAGLFIGSLFVDVAQLINGSGFSENVVKKSDVLTAGGKTWVAYKDPIVRLDVITDSTCGEKCSPDQALVSLKRAIPTLIAKSVDYNTPEGKALAEKTKVVSLPAFVFSEDIAKTEMFAQAEPIFVKQDDNRYLLSTDKLGMPAGKLLALPQVKDSDIQSGPKDAKVKVVEYSDFQCPYCKLMHPSIKQVVLNDYKDKVLFSYKQFPLSFHPQANNAALASECANEQGKFAVYSDNLFDKQAEWGQAKDTQKFKEYAVKFGLKAAQFNECLDTKKYQDKINADTEEGQKFGVTGTPGTFVNDQFIGGAVSADELKKIIDAELAK